MKKSIGFIIKTFYQIKCTSVTLVHLFKNVNQKEIIMFVFIFAYFSIFYSVLKTWTLFYYIQVIGVSPLK